MEHTGICDHCAQGEVMRLGAELEALVGALGALRRECDHEYRLAQQRAAKRMPTRQRAHVQRRVDTFAEADRVLAKMA